MGDPYSNVNNLGDQGRKLQVPVLSDSVDLLQVPKALQILTAGNIAITAADGNYDNTGTLVATSQVIPVTAGQVFYAVRPKRIWLTGTTATCLLIL